MSRLHRSCMWSNFNTICLWLFKIFFLRNIHYRYFFFPVMIKQRVMIKQLKWFSTRLTLSNRIESLGCFAFVNISISLCFDFFRKWLQVSNFHVIKKLNILKSIYQSTSSVLLSKFVNRQVTWDNIILP